MRKLILALFLCATLTVPAFAATPPPSETLSSIPAIASEAPSGVGDLTETPAETSCLQKLRNSLLRQLAVEL